MKHVIVILASLFFVQCKQSQPKLSGLEGKPMPVFDILLPDSTTWYNTKNIPQGKPAVILYYSPHCLYCKAQLNEIVDDMDQLLSVDFYLITSYPFKDMKEFSQYYGLKKYPNVTVGWDSAYFVENYFEAAGVPFMAIYDKNKILKHTYMGKVFTKQILASIKN